MTLLMILVGTVLLLCLAFFIVIRAMKMEQMWMKITGFSLAGLLVLAVLVTPVLMIAGRQMSGLGGRQGAPGHEIGMGRQMMGDRGQERFGQGGGNDRGGCPNGQFDGRNGSCGQGFGQRPGSGSNKKWNQMPNNGQQQNQGQTPNKIPNQSGNQGQNQNQQNTTPPTPKNQKINP